MNELGDLLSKSIADVLQKAAQRQARDIRSDVDRIDPGARFILGAADPDEIQIFADDDSPLAKNYADFKRREHLGELRDDPIERLLKGAQLNFLRMSDTEREQITKSREAETPAKNAADAMPGYVVQTIADDPEFTLLRRNRTTLASGDSLTKSASSYAQRVATWNAAIAAGADPHAALATLGKAGDGEVERMRRFWNSRPVTADPPAAGDYNGFSVTRMRERDRVGGERQEDKNVDPWEAFRDLCTSFGLDADLVEQAVRDGQQIAEDIAA